MLLLRVFGLLACFLLTGCTHILIIHGARINRNGKETMHCTMHINQNAITPELAQKARDFCKEIEGSAAR